MTGYEKRPTQEQRIISYILENGSITRIDAAMRLGVFELAARLDGLRKKGWVFEKERESHTSSDGYKFHVVRYRIHVDPDLGF